MAYHSLMALVPIAVIIVWGKAARVSMPMAAMTMIEAHTTAFKTAAPDVQAAHMAATSAADVTASHMASAAVGASSSASDR
jgi:hypothetical protein